jgi:histone H3/H4
MSSETEKSDGVNNMFMSSSALSGDAFAFQKQQQSQVDANKELIEQFWKQQASRIEELQRGSQEFKLHALPLARIKKIMKLDEDNVKMISADAPVLLAKACEIFVLELTLRSWTHTEQSRRRTLQRNDVSKAVAQSDMMDFLIDIVPREDSKPGNKQQSSNSALNNRGYGIMSSEQMEQYVSMQQKYFEMFQQISANNGTEAGDNDGASLIPSNMEQYAQQFQMPSMDPEIAAQYAQYYQDLYRQSEEYARDLQNTQGGTGSENGSTTNNFMDQYSQNLNTQLYNMNSQLQAFQEQTSNGGMNTTK